jgi:transcriptional regulator with XRE-family HTH domain
MEEKVKIHPSWMAILEIRALRSSLGETQAQFAARVGVALATLVRYESGAQRPKAAILDSFAAIAEQHQLSELAVAFREGVESRRQEAERLQKLDAETFASQLRELRRLQAEVLRRTPENITQHVSGEEYAHGVLWQCAQTQLRLARRNKREASYLLVTAVLMAYLALDAYLNYVGEILIPKKWSLIDQESSLNRSTAALTKVKKLVKVVRVPYPDEDTQPFSSILELSSLRNAILHAELARHGGGQVRSTPDRNVPYVPRRTQSDYGRASDV